MKEEWIKVVGWEFSSTWQQVKCAWFWQEKNGNKRSAKSADPCSICLRCHWVSVTPGVRDMPLVTARAALEDWVSNDTQCPEPEPEAESGVLVSDTILQRYMQASIHPEYFTINAVCEEVFQKEMWNFSWQPWSGMLWPVSARSHKLSGDSVTSIKKEARKVNKLSQILTSQRPSPSQIQRGREEFGLRGYH